MDVFFSRVDEFSKTFCAFTLLTVYFSFFTNNREYLIFDLLFIVHGFDYGTVTTLLSRRKNGIKKITVSDAFEGRGGLREGAVGGGAKSTTAAGVAGGERTKALGGCRHRRRRVSTRCHRGDRATPRVMIYLLLPRGLITLSRRRRRVHLCSCHVYNRAPPRAFVFLRLIWLWLLEQLIIFLRSLRFLSPPPLANMVLQHWARSSPSGKNRRIATVSFFAVLRVIRLSPTRSFRTYVFSATILNLTSTQQYTHTYI